MDVSSRQDMLVVVSSSMILIDETLNKDDANVQYTRTKKTDYCKEEKRA